MQIPAENLNRFSDPSLIKKAQKHIAKKILEMARKYVELGGEADISIYSIPDDYHITIHLMMQSSAQPIQPTVHGPSSRDVQ